MDGTGVGIAKEKVFEALVTAFTFVAALSWRETLVKIIEAFIPSDASRLIAEVSITLIITVIVILFIVLIVKTEKTIDETFDLDEETLAEKSK